MDAKKTAEQITEAIAQDIIERGITDGRKLRYAKEEWAQIAIAILTSEDKPAAQAPLGPNPLYTTHDVAHMLQVDASTVAKWIDRKVLLAFRTPGGHRRVRASDLREFVKLHKFPMPAELERGVLANVPVVDISKTT